MENFKIEVNPEESEIVQKLLFLVGSRWAGSLNIDVVDYTYEPYLYHQNKILKYSGRYDPHYFREHTLDEITFEEFIDKIETELLNGDIN
jgi:hypothetical protein